LAPTMLAKFAGADPSQLHFRSSPQGYWPRRAFLGLAGQVLTRFRQLPLAGETKPPAPPYFLSFFAKRLIRQGKVGQAVSPAVCGLTKARLRPPKTWRDSDVIYSPKRQGGDGF